MKRTTEQFVKEAKEIHGNRYDYSQTEYKNRHAKVKIICPIHGVFEQRASDHMNGCGCSKCSKVKKKTTEEFVKEAKEIHGDKYDYSLVEYKNIDTKVKIICPIHGVFEQTPWNHLHFECKECSKNRQQSFNTLENKTAAKNFIKKAKETHNNKYDYSLTIYKKTDTKVKIICPIHGVFEQTPSMHLSGQGCPKCKTSTGERKILNFFDKNKIIFISQKKFENLKDKQQLSYDFYIPSKNLLIEYNGSQHYTPETFGGISIEEAEQNLKKQRHHDWLKRKYAKDNGYKLLTIPYWDYNIIENILEEEINGSN